MPSAIGWLAFLVGALHLSLPAVAQQHRNVLILCVDDLRPELNCYGQDYIHSPNIDRLASRGVRFTHHFVQAPTCGASRYAMLTGTCGSASNDALFKRAADLNAGRKVPVSMPGWFRQHGYRTISVGKVSHHPGGWGGKDWNRTTQTEMPRAWDQSLLPAGKWKHPRGVMHGLADGEIRRDASAMDIFQSATGSNDIYPDGLITDEAVQQLEALSENKSPFFLAVGLLKPHLPLGAPQRYYERYQDLELPPIAHPGKPVGKTTWHRSGEFMKYNRWSKDPNVDREFGFEVRRHYAACVSYSDAMIGRILDKLKSTGQADNTIVVLWGDHGWHLGEHGVWGKHTLFEESLHAPLIVSVPGNRASVCETIVESVDIFPTLCALSGVPLVSGDGRSLQAEILAGDVNAVDESAIAYTQTAQTIRTADHRLILHNSGHTELYSYARPDPETKNVASEHPQVVAKLTDELHRRLSQ